MPGPRYTRQIVLFLVSAVLPALVLVGLASYVIQQDSELASRRAADERSRALNQVRRELSSKLSEITLKEVNRRIEGKSGAVPGASSAVVLVVPVEALRSPLQFHAADSTESEGQKLWEAQTQEQLNALAADFSDVRAKIDAASPREPNDFVWFAYGLEPWLVTITAPARDLPSLVVVVSSHQVAPPGTILVAGMTPTSTTLGQPFINMSVEWPPGPYAIRAPQKSAPVFIAGLFLILAIVVFAGYLLMRDMNREVRVAELRTHFVANVSHEIKTPLTAIRLYADKLAMSPSADERARGYVATIVNESDRLSRLVDNVLEFSRMETGAKIYRMTSASLADVVKSAARTVDYLMVQKGFTLAVVVEPDIPPLQIDPDAIEQAIINLLTNAVKYSGDSREIDLRVRRSKSEAVIEVADKGVGIHPEDLGRIFDKFYRVDSGETSHVAGTGLGLTLVRYIAAAHAGRVEVNSMPGRGSTFSIHIPLEAT